jgi:hypothetical protein
MDHTAANRYRVWIARYDHWRPAGPQAVPPRAVALEPAEPGTMSAAQAACYAEAFNRTALAGGRKIWAVVLPVIVRYDGDAQPGQLLEAPC